MKMPLETAMILYSAHWLTAGRVPEGAPEHPYRLTHQHHPCVKWAAASAGNYRWLAQHGLALCERYHELTRRLRARDEAAGKKPRAVRRHKCEAHIRFLAAHPIAGLDEQTPFAVAIGPAELPRVAVYRDDGTLDAHATYRKYASAEQAYTRWQRRAARGGAAAKRLKK
ncbi:MAG TPA: hypothetical protein VKD22_17335 [Ramlibacter sp.]|nr:hypothetical protein [Ramlibacter sp.]